MIRFLRYIRSEQILMMKESHIIPLNALSIRSALTSRLRVNRSTLARRLRLAL